MLDALSLSKRIGLGFALVIAALVALAAVMMVYNGRVADAFERSKETASQTIILNAYLEDLLEARLAAMAYREADTDEKAAEVASNLAEITESTAGLTAFANDPAMRAEMEALQQAANEYGEVFSASVELQQQRHVLVDQMLVLGREARVTLSDVHSGVVTNGLGPAAIQAAGGALQELILSRLYSERYLLNNDPEDLATARYRLDQLSRNGRVMLVALNGRDALRSQTEAALAQMDQFQSLLTEVEQVIAERNRLRGEVMDTIGSTITNRIDTALEGVSATQAGSVAAGQSVLSRTAVVLPSATALSIVLAVVIALTVGRSITGSVNALCRSTRHLAEGDVGTDVAGTQHGHEIGQMAQALVVFRDNEIARRAAQSTADSAHEAQKQVVDSVSGRLRQLADGDLTVQLDDDFPPEFQELKDNFNRTVARLNETISQVVENSNWIGENAQLVGDATNQLSRRNENQAAAIEETSASTSSLSDSVRDTSDRAKHARTLARTTEQSAAKGAKTVEDTTVAMDRIKASSDKISAIIALIEDVAFQTNLLALNAGVEAARAGEAGRGFAVVAQEVGALSQRSAEAVSEIRTIIAQAAEDVASGVETVGQAGTSIREIGEMVEKISGIIQEISDAATEQSDNLLATNASVKQIDTMTQENAAMSEETAATAKSLATGASSLLDVTSQFRTNGSGAAAPGRMVA